MPRHDPESGINEVIGTILIICLLVALAVIIGGLVMGFIVIPPKSAYIPPRIEVVDYAGSQAISLYSQGGDPAALDPGQEGPYVLEIYLDTDRGTFRVVPDQDVTTWNPGQTLYIYYNKTLSEYRAGGNVPEYRADPCPDTTVLLRVVDQRARLLVFEEKVTLRGGGTAGPTSTTTTSSTSTPTPTHTTPTVTLTQTPTPTPTCTQGTGWRIWNRDTIVHNYILKVEPSGPVISSGTIPAKTNRSVWYSRTTSYSGNLTTLENGESQVRGSGNLICKFDTYDQKKESPSSNQSVKTTLQLNPL